MNTVAHGYMIIKSHGHTDMPARSTRTKDDDMHAHTRAALVVIAR